MNSHLRLFLALLLAAISPWATAATPTIVGALYTMSNASSGNEILVYNRLDDGSLAQTGHVPTGGNGTGTGLGNQGALALSSDQSFLFAVNAGSDSISSFRVTASGLALAGRISSGGTRPVSLTEDRGRLFVLNAGNATTAGNITGFRVLANGLLQPIEHSTQALSSQTATTGAAQIHFSGDGRQLIVTEKATNNILTYVVLDDGVAVSARISPSSGVTPFGFAVGPRHQLFVANAAAGAAGASSLSSYLLPYYNGLLQPVSPAVATGETAACWVVLTPDGRFAFTTNAASGSLSSFRIGFGGSLALANHVAGTPGAGTTPIDMAVSPDGSFLYTLLAGSHSISTHSVRLDGTLVARGSLSGLPQGANGLVAR